MVSPSSDNKKYVSAFKQDDSENDQLKRTTVYLAESVIKGLDKCVEREGKGASRSKILNRLGARFAAVHIKGNPQLALQNWIGNINFQCFICDKYYRVLVRAEFISGLVAPVCRGCLDSRKDLKLTLKKELGAWKEGDKIEGLRE